MENYNAYTKVDGKLVSISQSQSSDVTKAYVDEQLNTKADKTELTDYLKSDALSNWAKAKEKPTYTAEEVGALPVSTQLLAINDETASSGAVYSSEKVQGLVDELGKSVSDGKTLVATAITDKGVATDANATFQTMADNITSIPTSGGATPKATLKIETDEGTLPDNTVSVYNHTTSENLGTYTLVNNTCTIPITTPGKYSISGEDTGDSYTFYANITADDILNSKQIVRKILPITDLWFDSLTWKQVETIINLHYEDKIDITDYWNIGDTSPDIEGFTAPVKTSNYYTTSTANYTISSFTFMIIGFNHDDLTTPINGHTKAAVTLLVYGPSIWGSSGVSYKPSATASDHFAWNNSYVRELLHENILPNLPQELRDIVKTVTKLTSGPSDTIYTSHLLRQSHQVLIETNDDIFLLSAHECSNLSDPSNINVLKDGDVYEYFSSGQILTASWGVTYGTRFLLRSSDQVTISSKVQYCSVFLYARYVSSSQRISPYLYGIASTSPQSGISYPALCI